MALPEAPDTAFEQGPWPGAASCGARRAALSFTGGKDCVLALHLAAGHRPAVLPQQGADSRWEVVVLVTFAPADPASSFKAHPLDVIRVQAEALGIQHVVCTVSAPFLEGYREAIAGLRSQYSIRALITGDILDVCDSFMLRAVQGTGVELVTPLWGLPRTKLLSAVWELGIDCVVTCVNHAKLAHTQAPVDGQACTSASRDRSYEVEQRDPERVSSSRVEAAGDCGWVAQLLGRSLTRELYEGVLVPAGTLGNVDACGEYGEYHTMVVSAPLFRCRVQYSADKQVQGEYAFLLVRGLHLTRPAESSGGT